MQMEPNSQTKRGRKRLSTHTLRPDGLTPEQVEILKTLAHDSGESLAALKRRIVTEFLEQFDYSKIDQGINNGEQPEPEAGVR